MDYRKYIIEMIMAFNQEHTRTHLYTLSCNEVSNILEELRMRDDVIPNCDLVSN